MVQPKWVVDSLTMWGTAVTGVSAALPSINSFTSYFFDFSIEPGWVEALNEGVKAAVMGVGSIVGVVMIVAGRWRAKKPLSLMKP